MIFQHTWEAIIEGRKTETRRLISPRDVYDPLWLPTTIMTDMCRIKYQVGKRYAVQPARGKAAVAHIRMLDIYPEDVRTISNEHVKAEGFETRTQFFEVWCSLHDPVVQFVNVPGSVYAGLRKEWKQGTCWGGDYDVDGVNPLINGLMTRPANRYQAFVYRFELA